MTDEVQLSYLTKDEVQVLKEFRESGQPGLAPSTSLALFQLFLNGNSFTEIQALNSGFKLGQILDAFVKYDWQAKKDKYVADLHKSVSERVIQEQMEQVMFACDVLAATRKRYGKAIRKYLQTEDVSTLEGFDVNNITSFSKAIDVLMKVTGQDKNIKVSGTVNKNVNVSGGLEGIQSKVLKPEVAAQLLAILADEDEK